jgi:hypothetical protein
VITLKGGRYVAECDGSCNAKIDTGLRSFQQAVNYISRVECREIRKTRGQWWNFCPRRGDAANPELDRVGVGFTLKPPDD